MIALKDARVEELDVEAALAASSAILSNAEPLWLGATMEQRLKLQAAIFPRGLTHDGESLGTAVTCLAFSALRRNEFAQEGLASPTGVRILYQGRFPLAA